MRMARACGLQVPLIKVVRDARGTPGLLVERFDRAREGDAIARLHVEDGCQALNLHPAQKYRVSVRELAQGLLRWTSSPGAEGLRLIEALAFSYLIANGDLHAKNLSLIGPPGGLVLLAPSYDLLSTLPYGDATTALKLGGKDANWKRRDLLTLARGLGIPAPPVERRLDRLLKRAEPWFDRVGEIGLDPKPTAHLARTMRERALALSS